MKQQEKQKVVDLLAVYCQQIGSQNKASKALNGVSSATISHLLNGNWEPYSDSMFRNLALQLGYGAQEWQFAHTTNSMKLLDHLSKAKQQQLIFTVLGNAGSGKSETTKKFAKDTEDCIRVEAGSYWTPGDFLTEILRAMGVQNPSNRVGDMMREIMHRLKDFKTPPILIIDEVDKLEDKILRFLITFYNELKGKCAIVLLSTHYFKKRLKDGLRLSKNGYEELMSRFGRFIEFEQTSAEDVKKICESNGITDAATIKIIAQKSRGDLRYVCDLITAKKSA